ncbi:MAG: cupin [Chloroflexi bacterium RBG_16_58_8]|nr:MAG: cupin [Chloroflexi bacterium RBG_16_58_8]
MDKENIGGKVMGLATMVDYQDGSVVSRTLVDRSGGTVTMFAFDKGQGLSEHTAPFDALVVVVDGEAEVSVSGIAQNVLSGQIILMPANDPHALRAVRRFKMMLVMVKS